MKSSPDEPHSIFTCRENDHARFRKAFAPAFLDRSLQEQAPVVEGYTDLFIEQMRVFAHTSVDMTQWFNYYTFDAAGDLSFGVLPLPRAEERARMGRNRTRLREKRYSQYRPQLLLAAEHPTLVRRKKCAKQFALRKISRYVPRAS